jgi:hypothetical protein
MDVARAVGERDPAARRRSVEGLARGREEGHAIDGDAAPLKGPRHLALARKLAGARGEIRRGP